MKASSDAERERERESQRVSFKGGRTYYDYIYPKLENNEERLKPSHILDVPNGLPVL